MDAGLFAFETITTPLGEMRWPGFREEIGITPGVRESGSYESPENDLLAEWFSGANPGDVFVDVGAHVGWFARLAARQGLVPVAIEPAPTNFALLAWNLRDCACQLVNAAAWDRIESLPLALSRHNSGDHRVYDHDDDGPIKGLSTIGLPLDLMVERAAFVKIDAQGADHRVLGGMTRIIAEHRPRIVLEFSPHHIRRLGDDPQEVSRYLRTLGYEVSPLDARTEEWAINNDWDCTLVLA